MNNRCGPSCCGRRSHRKSRWTGTIATPFDIEPTRRPFEEHRCWPGTARSSGVISFEAFSSVTCTSSVAGKAAIWRKVYEEFLALKKQCGEDTSSLTFEKFKGTLQRNKDALVARHSCNRVKFTVYVKEGKAALKASPVK